MSADETVTLTREEYDALIERIADLEDLLAAVQAEGDRRSPHEVAVAMIRADSPLRAFLKHRA